MAEWVQHPDFPTYEISDDGQVRHRETQHVRKAREDHRGYLRINIRHAGRHITLRIHKLVARTFLPAPPPGKTTVDHQDWDRQHNKAGNLKWASNSENAGRRQPLPSGPATHYLDEATGEYLPIDAVPF